MTDAEIIKALETHLSNEGECSECAYFENIGSCVGIMHKDLYDLINRQKAEIENQNQNFKTLVSDHRTLQQSFDNLKGLYEAEKARVEKAKEKSIYFAKERYRDNYVIDDEMLDNLVKEKVGESDV